MSVLVDLRDPSFCSADRLKAAMELAKPVLWWGGVGFGLAALCLVWRAVSQSKQRTTKLMRGINESRAERGTYQEQMQEIADVTGRPIGGLTPQPTKRH